MLDSRSVVSATRIANNAAARGVFFSPREDTPIAILNHAMRPVTLTEDRDSKESLLENILSAAQDNPSEMVSMSNHQEDLNELTDIISDRLLGEVGHLRNVVNPVIQKIKRLIEERRSELSANNPLNLSVYQVIVQPIYGQEQLRSQLANYSGRTTTEPERQRGIESRLLEDVSFENISEMLETPSAGFNGSLQMLLTDIAAGGELPIFKDTPLRGKEMYMQHGTVLTFLFLRALEAGKHPAYKMADLTTEERTYLVRLKAFYGRELEKLLNAIENDLSTWRFFLGVDYDNNTIYVNDVKYRRWLEEKKEQGASMEAVIGTFYRKDTAPDIDMLWDDPSIGVKAYERAEVLHGANVRSMTAKEVERLTEKELIAYFVDTIEEAAERQEKIVMVREYFKNAAGRLYANEDPVTYIAKAVCKLVGAGTDAYLMYTEMKTYLNEEENKDRSVKDAGAYAVVRLLMRWMACQVQKHQRENYRHLTQLVVGQARAE